MDEDISPVVLQQWADGRAMQDRFHRDALEVEHQFGFAVRTVIATAAGALTLSVGAFVREPPPPIGAELVGTLRFAWWALFAAIGVGAAALTLRYTAQQRSHVEWECREKGAGRTTAGSAAPDALGHRRRAAVNARAGDDGMSAAQLRGLSNVVLGVSVAGFLAGLVALARVAVSLLPDAPA